MALAIGAAPAHAATYTNSTPITAPSSGNFGLATPTGSAVTVSGTTGMYFRARVILHGVTATYIREMDVMLESPEGLTTMVMSDVGGGTSLNNHTLDIADLRAAMPAGQLTESEYGPTNLDSSPCNGRPSDDAFGAPAPAAPTTAAFESTFRRTVVNGTWKLWVMDDCNGDPIAITGGWSLDLQAYDGVRIPASGSSGAAATYPINVPVAGQGTSVTKVVATLGGINHTAGQDLDVLLVGPTGASTLLMSDTAGGLVENLDGEFIFDDAGQPVPANGSDAVRDAPLPFRPTNSDAPADTFPAPAPPGPYGSALSAFDGTNPNGTWKLFIVDDATSDVGSLGGAVTLKITSTTPAGPPVTTTQTVKPAAPAARDSSAPFVRIGASKVLKLGSVLKSGSFRIPVITNEKSRISAQALVPSSLAKKLKLPPNGKAFTSAKKATPAIVATGKAAAAKGGTVQLKLKLTRKARRVLGKRGKSIKLDLRTRVTDSAGNRRLVKTKVKLKP